MNDYLMVIEKRKQRDGGDFNSLKKPGLRIPGLSTGDVVDAPSKELVFEIRDDLFRFVWSDNDDIVSYNDRSNTSDDPAYFGQVRSFSEGFMYDQLQLILECAGIWTGEQGEFYRLWVELPDRIRQEPDNLVNEMIGRFQDYKNGLKIFYNHDDPAVVEFVQRVYERMEQIKN